MEIIPEDGHHSSSTSFPEALPLKESDIYKAVFQVTEKIHGEFGAAAIMTGLSGKIVCLLNIPSYIIIFLFYSSL